MSSFDSALVSLLPANPGSLVVSGGAPVEDLHLTLWFIPTAATSPVQASKLASALSVLAAGYRPVTARVYRAITIGDPRTASALQVVAKDIAPIRADIKSRVPEIPDWNHKKFIPHVSLGYHVPVQPQFTGKKILFDRVALWWPGRPALEYRLSAR